MDADHSIININMELSQTDAVKVSTGICFDLIWFDLICIYSDELVCLTVDFTALSYNFFECAVVVECIVIVIFARLYTSAVSSVCPLHHSRLLCYIVQYSEVAVS